MSDILVIPDVHGSHEWERAKTEKFDYCVCFGDSCDSWENKWPDQGENIKNLFNWIREDPEHRKYVCGNHDFSYFSGTRDSSLVSGHQANHHTELRSIFLSNIDLIDIAFEIDGWVFSHAGFSKTWMNYLKREFHVLLDKFPDEDPDKTEFASQEEYIEYMKKVDETALIWDEKDFGIDLINKIWHSLSHFHGDENFYFGIEELFDWHGCFSGSGDEITQGPLWIRPSSLLSNAYYRKQCVGHTELAIDGPICIGSEVKIGDKEKELNRIIVFDSPKHLLAHFDTNLDPEYITVLEFNKRYKKLRKAVDDVKSLKLVSDVDIRKVLADKTTKRQAEYLYKMFFEE